MNILYHDMLCPFSRQARFYLKELDIEHKTENFEFYIKEHKPISELFLLTPILKISQLNLELIGIYPIIEYFNDVYQKFFFMDNDISIKSEIRKYISLFNIYFYREVLYFYIYERVIKCIENKGEPETDLLNKAIKNLNKYLEHISNKLQKNDFLINEKISCADITAAAHISVLDYFNAINWDKWQKLAHWYSLIKSQKGFQGILKDKIVGFEPSKNYSNLDFI
ncbi:MAG: glutathione S-transferase family protein [Rickettsia sp.]|nr:glutathione S-transferase family protein [Rickettsia sp.]